MRQRLGDKTTLERMPLRNFTAHSLGISRKPLCHGAMTRCGFAQAILVWLMGRLGPGCRSHTRLGAHCRMAASDDQLYLTMSPFAPKDRTRSCDFRSLLDFPDFEHLRHDYRYWRILQALRAIDYRQWQDQARPSCCACAVDQEPRNTVERRKHTGKAKSHMASKRPYGGVLHSTC